MNRFSAEQIATLRAAYAGKETADPRKLDEFRRVLGNCQTAGLEQLADAGINFVSKLARNELTRRKLKVYP